MAIELDDLAPNFRQAATRWPDAPTLVAHYRSLRTAYETNDHGLIGIAKSFVECVARTIIAECGGDVPGNDSTTGLLGTALRHVGLRNSRGASKVDEILSTHNRFADALSEIRNNHDPGAHGKDGFLDSLTVNEMRAFLLTADTVTALMLNAFEGHEPDISRTREPYSRFEHLHRRIDGRVPFESSVEESDAGPILVLRVRTEPGRLADAVPVDLLFPLSRLLYELDRDAYLEVLEAASRFEPISAETGEEDKSTEPTGSEVPATRTSGTERTATRTTSPPPHLGELAVVSQGFAEVVVALRLAQPDPEELSADLLRAAESALALDWKKRVSVRAAISVALRRTLMRRGVDRSVADDASAQLLGWLVANAPETSGHP